MWILVLLELNYQSFKVGTSSFTLAKNLNWCCMHYESWFGVKGKGVGDQNKLLF